MATTTVAIPKTKGGAFLIEHSAPEEIFTPEDFTDEHRAIAKTTDEFWQKEVTPHIDEIRHQDHALCAKILRNPASWDLQPCPAGKIRRHGNGPDIDDGGRRRPGARRLLFRVAWRAYRHRHAASVVVRNGSAEGKVSYRSSRPRK